MGHHPPRLVTPRFRARLGRHRELTFLEGAAALVVQAGHEWSFDGEALTGPRAGERLNRVGTNGFFWFAWSTFHPETAVYNASDSRPTDVG